MTDLNLLATSNMDSVNFFNWVCILVVAFRKCNCWKVFRLIVSETFFSCFKATEMKKMKSLKKKLFSWNFFYFADDTIHTNSDGLFIFHFLFVCFFICFHFLFVSFSQLFSHQSSSAVFLEVHAPYFCRYKLFFKKSKSKWQ